MIVEKGALRRPLCAAPLFRAAALVVVMTFAARTRAAAQRVLTGWVVDDSGQPVAGASVSAKHHRARVATDRQGRFKLTVSSDGDTVLAQRIGYLPTEFAWHTEAREDSITIRLRSLPALLKGITVDAPFAPPLSQTLTSQNVRQVPPLLEPDVFRALTLLPGVSQPNDLRGRVHLAGGASDETAVRLDGHPLQDPFHLFGLLGAFNVAALEQATVQIHHVPLEASGSLSGVIDLQTKAAGSHDGEATVSLLTAGMTAAPALPGGFDLLVSGRSSYLKAFADVVYSDAQLSRGDVPLYDARDAVVRLGRGRGATRWEAIGFATRDGIENNKLRGQAGYEPLSWGEGLLGLRGGMSAGGWALASRASVNRASISTDERLPGAHGDFVDLRRDIVSAAATARRAAARVSIEIGGDVQKRAYAQSWKVTQANTDIFSPRTPNVFSGDSAVARGSVFASATKQLLPDLTVTLGSRAQIFPALAFLAPQITASYRINSGISIDFSLERRYQFDAELEEPVEGAVGTPRFLLAVPRAADVAGGAFAWKRHSVTASNELRAYAFLKTYRRDVRLKESAIGARVEVAPPSFPTFEPFRAFSRGIGLTASRAAASGIALQGSYTYTRGQDRLVGDWSPRDADIPHSAIGFLSVPVNRFGMDLTAAMQVHSGAAITPATARVFVPDERTYYGLLPRYLEGDRNSFRLPSYRRLDVGTRRTWHRSKLDVTLSVQVLNLLMHRNPRDVSWDLYYDYLANGDPDPLRRASSGLPGLPILPSLGLEIKW